MFSKEEASNLRHEFWTTFGRYMAPVPGAEGEQVNWINYKTGFKDIFFRMQTLRRSAVTGILLVHKDPELQELFFEQFLANKSFLESITGESWQWELHVSDENGRIISRTFTELKGVSVMNRNDWPELIAFFKKHIIMLDQFWSIARYGFDRLR